MFTPPISMGIDVATIAYNKARDFFSKKPLYHENSHEKNAVKKEVSVLVPAFNEGEKLRFTIESIVRQTYPVKDVYILDDLSTDNTEKVCNELAKNYENVRHVRREIKHGKAGNINSLVSKRKEELGEYILVVDGDVQLKKDCLENLIESADNAAVVTGFGSTKEPKSLVANMLYEGESWINSVFSFRKKAQSMRNSVFVVCGALSLYKKDILQKMPIPERTTTEDTDYTWLLLENNQKVVYNSKGKAQGSSPNSLEGYWKRYTRWFSGTFQNLYIHGSELNKSKKLLYTTILPGVIEAIPYSAAIASLPITAIVAPEWAKGVLAADFILSAPFLFMHPRGFWHAVNHLPDIYAYKYFGSVACLYAGIKTSTEKIFGKEKEWRNNWENSGKADIRAERLSKRFLKRNFSKFMGLEKEWEGIGEQAWQEKNFMLEMPEKWKLSSYVDIDDRLAGYAIASNIGGGKAFLHKIVVDSDYKRLGIGSTLLESTMEKCRKRSIETIVFKANVNNLNANGFYKKYGGLITGKEKSPDNHDRYIYELQIKQK